MYRNTRSLFVGILAFALISISADYSLALGFQQNDPDSDTADTALSHAELPLEAERSVSLETDEGTWMSVDVHPTGDTLIFDYMGDLYELPVSGGEAEQLTDGMAFDSQPRYSPDGSKIAFISDRSGGDNLWILDRATGEVEQRTKGKNYWMQSPEWSPDGTYIIAARTGLRSGVPKLRLYHKDGGSGSELMDTPGSLKTIEPAFGENDRYVWFSQRRGNWDYNADLPQYQIAKLDRETGERHRQTARQGSAFRPTLSSDGKWLVYGTRYETETGLRIRDLETGDERWLAYPVQRDDQESRAPLDVLPTISFTPDNKAVVASYGGKLWRIPIAENKEAQKIPFQIDTDLEMGPRLDFQYPIEDTEHFTARQIRDAVPSPEGDRLAFTVLNDLYVMDLPDGEPRRVTDFESTEAFPTWSPDGRWIAFSTWNEEDGGHIYRVRSNGSGNPERLTRRAALYQQLAWSKTQDRIVAVRGEDRMYYQSPGPYIPFTADELVWLPSEGGQTEVIASTEGRRNPHFTKNSDRIYLFDRGEGLLSIRYDGTDEKEHVEIKGSKSPGSSNPERPSKILMAPSGDQALAQIDHHLYTVTVPNTGETPSISVSNPDKASFPARKLTDIGGQFPAWDWSGRKVHFSIGNGHFIYDLDEAAERERAQERYDREQEEKEEEESDESEESEEDEENSTGEEEEDAADEPERPEDYEADSLRIQIDVPRDLPRGTLVLRGARVVTMDGDEVIEKADLVIRDNRIAAVGEQGSVEIPDEAEIRDVEGRTIVPGFVDTHAHIRPFRDLHVEEMWSFMANLAYGVTTIRDPQTATTDMLTYEDKVKSGQMLGPRIYQTGPGIFFDEQIEDLDHARDVIRRYSKYYDTKSVKMYVAGNREQRQWILKAAEEQEITPTTEGSLNMKLEMTMLIDGYPGQEHNYPITPIYEDVIKTTAESKMAYTPTLLVTYGGPFGENYFFTNENPLYNQKLRYFTPRKDLDDKTRRRGVGWFHEEEYSMDRQSRSIEQIYDAGGIIGVGSHGQLQGLGYHWELWAMGWDIENPHKVLRMATLQGAEALGLDDDLGSIDEGKLADLLILEENPLDDLRNTTELEYVMKNGRLYNDENLNQVWPEKVERGKPWFHQPEPENVPGLNDEK